VRLNDRPDIALRRLIAKAVIVVAAVLIAGELLASALIMSPSPQIYDPALGFTYVPNADVFWGVEGFARNRYNRLGLNNDEIAAKSRQWRVLAIGDSYVEARQVPRDENFASVAERRDKRVEVVNAGREGLNVASFPLVAERLAPRLAPDLIVVVLSQSRLDDFANSKVVIAVDGGGTITSVRYLIERQDMIKEKVGSVLRRSALLTTLGWKFKDRILGQLSYLLAKPMPAAPAPVPMSRRIAAEDDLAFVLRHIRSSGKLAVLYLPHLRYLPGGIAEQAPGSASVEETIRRVATQNDIPFYSAIDEFLAVYKETGRPTQGFSNGNILDGHLNYAGHRALGEALARMTAETLSGRPDGIVRQ
jgi:hypothetical protein